MLTIEIFSRNTPFFEIVENFPPVLLHSNEGGMFGRLKITSAKREWFFVKLASRVAMQKNRRKIFYNFEARGVFGKIIFP